MGRIKSRHGLEITNIEDAEQPGYSPSPTRVFARHSMPANTRIRESGCPKYSESSLNKVLLVLFNHKVG